MDEAAVVRYKFGGEQDIQVRVAGVRKGSVADFASFDDKSKKMLAGLTPYYVDITAVAVGANHGGLRLASIGYGAVGALDQDGDPVAPLVFPVTSIASFNLCPENIFDAAGAKVETCLIFGATVAQTLTSVTWQDYNSDYNDFDGKPITWS
jgi:hypothetical protein